MFCVLSRMILDFVLLATVSLILCMNCGASTFSYSESISGSYVIYPISRINIPVDIESWLNNIDGTYTFTGDDI